MLKKTPKLVRKPIPKRKPPSPVTPQKEKQMTNHAEPQEEILPLDDEEEPPPDDPESDEPEPEPEPEPEEPVADTLPHVSGHRDLDHTHEFQERCIWEPGKPTADQLAAAQEMEKTVDGFKEAKQVRIEQLTAEKQGELDAAVGKKKEPKEE